MPMEFIILRARRAQGRINHWPRTQAHPSFSLLHAEKQEGLGDEVMYMTVP